MILIEKKIFLLLLSLSTLTDESRKLLACLFALVFLCLQLIFQFIKVFERSFLCFFQSVENKVVLFI